MNHFKMQIIINDIIENFDKNKMIVDFSELRLKNPDNNEITVFKDRKFYIIYTNLEYPITFNIFIQNDDQINNKNRIDYLLDEDYVIDDIILDIYYNDELIENYEFNEVIGEQVDLIDILKNLNTFDITNAPIISQSSTMDNLDFFMIPRNDKNIPVINRFIEYNSDDYQGIEFNKDGTGIRLKGYTILDKFNRVDLFLVSDNSIIAPKDLDNFTINISNCMNISFKDITDIKMPTIHNLLPSGIINRTYCTPFFRYSNIKALKIGQLYKINNNIWIDIDVQFLRENKLELILNLK